MKINSVAAYRMFVWITKAMDLFKKPGDVLHRFDQGGWRLYLEDGHQSRETTMRKIGLSPLWQVDREEARYVKLKPLKL